MRLHAYALVLGALLLGGCALVPQFGAAKEAAKQGIVLVKQAHFKAAMANEDLRCQRPTELILKMADKRGDEWFSAYVASCPNIRALLSRMVGVTAVSQSFKLIAVD